MLCRARANEAAGEPLSALEDTIHAWVLDRSLRDFEVVNGQSFAASNTYHTYHTSDMSNIDDVSR